VLHRLFCFRRILVGQSANSTEASSMRCTVVVFEKLTLVHLPILLFYLWRDSRIEFFHCQKILLRWHWMQRLIAKGRIAQIPPIGYQESKCCGEALDNVDKVWNHLIGGRTLVKDVKTLFQNPIVETAYKKELAGVLSEYYHVEHHLSESERVLEKNERIVFVPYLFKQYRRLVERSGAFCQDNSQVEIWGDVLGVGHLSQLACKLKWWIVTIGLGGVYSCKLIMANRRPIALREYEYAIALTNPVAQFRTKPVDFLLDGVDIRADNTVFLLLNPLISASHVATLVSKGLHVFDATARFGPSPNSSWNHRFAMAKEGMKLSLKILFLGLLDPAAFARVHAVLLHVYFRWSFVLNQITFKNFVAFNDEGLDQIGRNTLLNNNGSSTWYYAHSNSLAYLVVPQRGNIRDWRHSFWAYLNQDHLVSWSQEMADYYALHPQSIRRYESVGCLWSQLVVDIIEGRISTDVRERVFNNLDLGQYQVVSFFDAAYRPDSLSPMEDGVAFYRGALKLLEEFPKILVIVKQKRAAETLWNLWDSLGGEADVFYQGYLPVLEALKAHPRCRVVGHEADPSEVIAISNLVVTYAFSSPTVEALGARKKGIFFDPSGRYRGYPYDAIPDLMAHDYGEMKSLVRKLLYETSEQEYDTFLDSHVKGRIDPYLDGKAITRFRRLLSAQLVE